MDGRWNEGDSKEVENARSTINKFEEAKNYQGFDKIVTWKEYLDGKEKDRHKFISFKSGFTELDTLVDGFQTGELISVSGNTGQGKTLLIKSLVKSFGQSSVPITVFSFEDPAERFLGSFKDIPNLETVYVPLELTSGSLEWIERKVYESVVKFDSKIVVIDHLHYIVDMNLNKNFSLNVGAAMRFIKEKVSVELGQIVFLVAHQEKIGNDEEPSLATIRDSSFIGQESDMVFIVNRLPDSLTRIEAEGPRSRSVKLKPSEWTFDSGYSSLKIEKARRSGIHRKKITFQKRGLFLEPV